MFYFDLALYANKRQNDARKNVWFFAASPAKKDEKQLARAEGAREKN